tara:strand:- start:149 stop:403 length:255 start_codon:yes stop_codon:yes gene_type:complete
MDDKTRQQFLLESTMINKSCKFTTKNALLVNEKYEHMSPEDLQLDGPEILRELEYWEGRCKLEDRILARHMIKYEGYTDENEGI